MKKQLAIIITTALASLLLVTNASAGEQWFIVGKDSSCNPTPQEIIDQIFDKCTFVPELKKKNIYMVDRCDKPLEQARNQIFTKTLLSCQEMSKILEETIN